MKIQPIRTMITPSALVCGYAALVMLCLSPVSSVAIGPIVPALPSPTPTPSPTPSPTVASTATPVAPALVNYQGRLALAAGGLPENGSYKISVTIYDRSVGGTAIWAQRFDNAQVVDGQFNVVLGAGQAVSDASTDISKAFDQPDRYLETSFEGGPAGLVKQTIQPRQQLMSAPYARVSQFAQAAQFALHGVPPGTVVPYAGSGPTTPEGWVMCDGAVYDSTADLRYTELFRVIGTTYGGTGPSNFKVPDCRGIFVRGAGSQTIGSETYSATLSQKQNDETAVNSMAVQASGTLEVLVPRIGVRAQDERDRDDERVVNNEANRIRYDLNHSHQLSGAPETRPANLALNYIIKL